MEAVVQDTFWTAAILPFRLDLLWQESRPRRRRARRTPGRLGSAAPGDVGPPDRARAAVSLLIAIVPGI